MKAHFKYKNYCGKVWGYLTYTFICHFLKQSFKKIKNIAFKI